MKKNRTYKAAFMNNFIMKYFGRIMAILGCSTLVTACYGVPYDEYDPHARVSGRVVDSETDQPIQDIKVRAVPANESFDSYPYDFTDLDGYFNIGDFDPSTTEYIIECTDIDGEMNGSYESVTKEIAYDESLDIVIKMTHKRQ